VPEALDPLLVEQLQDLVHAEGQLLKGLRTMIEAPRAPVLRFAFEKHPSETDDQVERLKAIFTLLGVAAKSTPSQAWPACWRKAKR
jgi:Mn-containing catalase